MNNKEAGFEIRTRARKVNPEEVWGSHYQVPEIIGQGSGSGFTLKGLHLPKEWENQAKRLESINPEVMANTCQEYCSPWEFSLRKLRLDNNNVLKEVVIKNNKTNRCCRLSLSGSYFDQEKGIYISEDLKTIEPAIILQQIGCTFLRAGWHENGYPCVSGNRRTGFGPGFGQNCLQIPEKYYYGTDIVTRANYQEKFINNAHNIAGRFGTEIRSIHFSPRGILDSVDVQGDRTGYFLDLDDKNNPRFSSHNVDTPEQATVLHNIIASHINFLLDKDNLK